VVVAEGLILNMPVVLLEIKVPLHESVNNIHVAPVPNEPPLTVRVLLEPVHTEDGFADNDEGAIELELTVSISETQEVVSQGPEA